MTTIPDILLATKWAVRINSEADAKELQLLLPLIITQREQDFVEVYKWGIKKGHKGKNICLSDAFTSGRLTGVWCFAHIKHYKMYGYTIYTINELKELLK